ncbi:TonB-dependent receptor domain-containing protein [Flavobacterium sp.]|uniref:TonB-dependent receptor domain-containing protein n=1 Tax=Flavobacterium sp. TaxID=239 RepID=UPI0037507EEB
MQKNLFGICFLLCIEICFAQNSISGKIYNTNNSTIVGSHVHIGSKSVSSDSDGNYSIKNLPIGLLKVNISCVGYQTIDSTITVLGNSEINFVLKAKQYLLNEVIVKTKKNTYNQSVLEQKIKTETIEKYSNQSLGEALKEVTGVSILKTGSNIMKPIINGLHSSRVPVITNNVRLEDQQWGSEHAPNFDVNAAAKITVIKGASGLQYSGDAVGGLIIIEPTMVKKDTLFGKTLLSLASNGRGGTISSSLHKGNDKNWSWNTLATYKYLGDRTAPNYVLSNTGNREINFTGDVTFSGKKYDVSAFYSLYNANNGILSASHTGNVNDLYNSINNQIPAIVEDFTYTIKNPKQQVQHHIAKFNYNYFFNETASLATQYSFQFNKRLEFDVRRGDFNNKAALDLQLKTHTVNVDYKKVYHDWNLKSGISGSYQNNFANPSTGIRPLIPNYDKVDAGIYVIANHNFTESLTFDTGIRYDFSTINATKFYLKSRWDERNYSPEFDNFIVGENGNQWLTKPNFTFHNLSTSAGIHYEFQKKWDLYFNVSLASRNPNPSEFFSDGLHHSTGVIELGDLKLEKEKSFKVATTLLKKWTGFSISFNPYINSIYNYMFLKPVGFETTIRGAFPVWEYQQTNALLTGFDLETQLSLNNNWNHQFSLALVHGRDVSNKESLIDMPPLNSINKIQFSKKEWHQLVLELKSEIVTRQTQFPNNNFETNIIVNETLTPIIVDVSSPPKGYHLLHFYSEIKFKTINKINTTIAFSIQNLLNTNYRDYLNRQRFFADEMGRNLQLQLKINY